MSNKYITTILNQDSSTKEGSAALFPTEFVVNGIRYRSIPDSTAASKAKKLFSIFSPYKGKSSELGKGAEASREGRSVIGRYIYYPLDPKGALEYTNKLGTGSESFWSSWFFGNVYAHNPEYRKLSTVGNKLSGYPHAAGMKNRNNIDQNPDQFKGKTDYVMFSFDEAPVDVGDSIVAINRSNPQSFSTFKSKAEQMQSHGRVVAKKGFSSITLHGGNESGTVGVDDIPIKNGKLANLDSSGRLIHPGSPDRYTGLLKKVEILGPNNVLTISKSYLGKAFKLGIYGGLAFAGYKTYKKYYR
jgi:hypothetical protein